MDTSGGKTALIAETAPEGRSDDALHDPTDPRACAPNGSMMASDCTSAERAARHAARGLARCDPHGRLRAGVLVTERNHHRAIRIAFEAARLVTLPTRAAPRLYTRKGVRYAVFAEEGVIWVVQEVASPSTNQLDSGHVATNTN